MNGQELVRERLKAFYSEMDASKLTELEDFYHPSVKFSDPVHAVNGVAALKEYLANSIKNVDYCHFKFVHEIFDNQGGYLTWRMHFSHPKVNKGQEVIVPGVSQLTFGAGGGRVTEHTDYYDMGALLYEYLPVMGWVTQAIKSRMKSS